jgi:hypothetical protein
MICSHLQTSIFITEYSNISWSPQHWESPARLHIVNIKKTTVYTQQDLKSLSGKYLDITSLNYIYSKQLVRALEYSGVPSNLYRSRGAVGLVKLRDLRWTVYVANMDITELELTLPKEVLYNL